MGTDSIWEDEKILEMDGGNGHPTMWMYLMPLNCILKMVKRVGFCYVCVTTIIKSKGHEIYLGGIFYSERFSQLQIFKSVFTALSITVN